MTLPPLRMTEHFIPIPEVFHSFQYGRPFEHCTVCNRGLLEGGIPYIIEKGFRGDEVIYELVLCVDCQEGMIGELSEDSTRRIDAHFEERADFVERRRHLLEVSPDAVESWIDTCVLSKKERREQDSYQIYAHCDGGDLMFTYLPIMICGEAVSGIEKLLSKKTKDVLGGFTETYLGMPPEFCDFPSGVLSF